MKKKWIWLPAVLILVLAGGFLGLRLWLHSPGIHVFGKELYADVSGKCYIIDGTTGEVVDETTLTIDGGTEGLDAVTFQGDLKILGYHNTADGIITASKMIEKRDNGCWQITHLENCTHQEEQDGIIKPYEHFCDYHYVYYLYPKEPDLVVVLIDSFDKPHPQYAVMADSEEQALERYQMFLRSK